LEGGDFNQCEYTVSLFAFSDCGKDTKKKHLLGWPVTLERFQLGTSQIKLYGIASATTCFLHKKINTLSHLVKRKRLLHSYPFPSLVNVELHKIWEHGNHKQALARSSNNYYYMGSIVTVHFLKQRRNSCQGT
jgi:hypothetical protein